MKRMAYLFIVLLASGSAFAATAPLFSDNFTVSANNNNVSVEIPGVRQSGSRAPLTYLEEGLDSFSQVNAPSYEGRLFMSASGASNLVKVSPNSNFNLSPGTNGVFYIEFEVHPVLTLNVGTPNTTMSAWAAVKFGSAAQNKTVNDADGFGILFRGETDLHFQAFDGTSAAATPAAPNDFYSSDTSETFHKIRIELRRVTAGPDLFDGTPVQIKAFADNSGTPFLTYVRAAGFTSNFISLVSETEGSGGDGVTHHAFDNLRVTSAPFSTISLGVTGGLNVTANSSFNAVATETGVTAKVEFFIGGTKVGEDTTSSDGFTFDYPGQASGTYSLTARATDIFGATTTSAPVNIVVSQKPTVAVTFPLEGSVIASTVPITAVAAANDVDGTVAKVEFFLNGAKFGEDTNGSDGFSFAFGAKAPGVYTFSAIATDNQGFVSTTSAVNIRVSSAPTISITSPVSGTVLDEPATLSLNTTASDADGFIAKVEFFANGVKVAENLSGIGGFSATLPDFAPGLYSVTAIATDNVGLSTQSVPVAITIRKRPKFDSAPTLAPNPVVVGQDVIGLALAGEASILWNWGDGSSTRGNNVAHTYTASGIYAVTATATSSDGVITVQAFSLFAGQRLFDASSSYGQGVDGISGVLIGGEGVNAILGAAVKVKCNYLHRSRTSMSAKVVGVNFSEGFAQSALTNVPGTLRIGGAPSIPYSFSLSSKGIGKSTSLKKIELNVKKQLFTFSVSGQAELTDLLEGLGAQRVFGAGTTSTVRIPATLQIGTQFFLALTFEIDFTAKGTSGKGGLAK